MRDRLDLSLSSDTLSAESPSASPPDPLPTVTPCHMPPGALSTGHMCVHFCHSGQESGILGPRPLTFHCCPPIASP